MNRLFRSILNYLRGNTIRGYLVVLPDQGRTKKQLKLEDLRHEFGLMDLHWRELSLQQKRVEHMLTDLTRCIRGLEFDVKLNSNLKMQAKQVTKSTPDAPTSDKQSPKVGDFSGSKIPSRASPVKKHKHKQQQQQQQL